MTQPELTDDAEANRLMLQIGRQMVARDLIRERIRWLERKIEYRTNKIRELSLRRSEALNLTLPLT